jgi:hypothetical protein
VVVDFYVSSSFLVLNRGGIPHPDPLPRAAIAESGFRPERSSMPEIN